MQGLWGARGVSGLVEDVGAQVKGKIKASKGWALNGPPQDVPGSSFGDTYGGVEALGSEARKLAALLRVGPDSLASRPSSGVLGGRGGTLTLPEGVIRVSLGQGYYLWVLP